MHIDPTKVDDAQVFRSWGWHVALIVSEQIKEALERAGISGMKFTEVTGPGAPHPKEHVMLEQAVAAREAFWRTLGRLDEEALVPIAGGDSWPAHREVWRVIHRPGGSTLWVTDGLSDPFHGDAEPSVGFGLELGLEVDESLEEAAKGWPLQLLARVADEVVMHERVRTGVKAGFMSMEVSGQDMPGPLVTKEGRVGVLLELASNTPPGGFHLPAGAVKLVTVKALLPEELEYLLTHGKTGRQELLRRFEQAGHRHLCRAWRRSVV